ncbi:hypothetical protein ACFXPV_04725 [Streptomyces sp. NPDC059118]|uniref:hypothetical protein n=1 Tax=unclassified Streptomyces TaxID=2593676 RepID=UPI0036CD29CE
MTSTPHRGRFAWLRTLFGPKPVVRPFEAVAVDVPEFVSVHRNSTVVFETPARGDGFGFQVEIRCDWCAEGRLDEERLSTAIDSYQTAMPQRLTERVRDVARRYEPFRAEEAELAVNQALQEGECFENGLVSCRTVANLQPAPEVLEQQRRAALELQDIEHRYAKSALQVKLLSDVAEKWRAFLVEGLAGVRQSGDAVSWLTPWAVLLAEQPDKAATEVGDMFRQRQKQVDEFVKLLEKQAKGYQAQDLFEFVVTNEQQLGHAMRLFGLPLPGELDSEGGLSEPLPRAQSARG